MIEITGKIKGGDYASAGHASKEIKTALKRIGADAAAVRRAMVAVYEAEMNVVIHARQGMLRAAVTPDALEVEVCDSGPGIADMAQAMSEGFSTAPPEAREFGFGAGMGLPNIRRNTNRFSIHSDVGHGTRLQFAVVLAAQPETETFTASVSIDPEKCKCCLRCLHVCPTQAVRLRDNAPIILPHLCIGCAACRSVCPENVYGVACPDKPSAPTSEATLYLPAPLRGQFGFTVSEEMIRDALAALGWNKVWFGDAWENALNEAVENYAQTHESPTPLLPPVCPAVVNLIQVRYPSLLGNVPPFLSALESARESITNGQGVFVVPCAAMYALAHESSALRRRAAVTPGELLRMLSSALRPSAGPEAKAAPDADASGHGASLIISGIERVCQFLDKAEDGRVNDCRVAHLYACDSGCFGSPVWPEHPEISKLRGVTKASAAGQAATALFRPKPLEARAGLRLDPDMGKAIAKLAQIDRIRATLPGRDCGVCGSPSCLALAEDIVMGRATALSCVYKKRSADSSD
ncbi:MAG TPA: hypothetical protein ENN29_13645 [Candidatus Hydrogenedentes bacterium]|nr:hypothetical protein [Candidatus Hydrogenedentota bacterium]